MEKKLEATMIGVYILYMYIYIYILGREGGGGGVITTRIHSFILNYPKAGPTKPAEALPMLAKEIERLMRKRGGFADNNGNTKNKQKMVVIVMVIAIVIVQ